VNIGFKEGSTEADGTSLPMVAAIQEFGAPRAGIPPRPFMRATIAAHKGEWPQAVADLLVAMDYDARATLGIVGDQVKGQMQDSIRDLMEPALSPVTIMLRSMRRESPDLVVNASTVVEARRRVAAGETPKVGTSDKPLVDIGTMLQNVSYQVE
jgi:hypothetical protein